MSPTIIVENRHSHYGTSLRMALNLAPSFAGGIMKSGFKASETMSNLVIVIPIPHGSYPPA